MKVFLFLIFFSSTSLFSGQTEDFNKYKKEFMSKCQAGDSDACKNLGAMIDSKSNKNAMYTIACSGEISDACYKINKSNKDKKANNQKDLIDEDLELVASSTLVSEKPHLTTEISGSSSMGLNITRANSNTTYAFDFGVGLDISVNNTIQLGFAPAFGFASGDVITFGFMFGPTFNATIGPDEDIRNAFFVSLKGGLIYLKVADESDTVFGGGLAFGKRFHIAGNFVYKPYLSFMALGSPTIVQVNFMPMSFSAFF